MADTSQSEAGRVIAHYVVERVLGRGSAGIVYLARDSRINRLVALKCIDVASQRFEDSRDAEEFFQRLQREVEVCGGLNHPGLVTLYDAGYDDGRVSWLALEYVHGQSLLELIRAARPEPLPLDRALSIAADVLQGLAYAHGKGIVHRDIKPANILVSDEGGAKIADFGIARPSESLMTVAGTLMGTPNYMSPEQVKGLIATPQSDLFSFGVVLYEMLTSRKAFGAADVSGVLYNIVHRAHEPVDAPGVPAELVRLVDRLLAKSRDERPASATEVLEEIQQARSKAITVVTMSPVDPEEPTEKTDPTPQPGSEPTLHPDAEQAPLLYREVPRQIARGFVALAAAGLIIPSLAIALQLDSSPSAPIPDDVLREFQAKREQLAAADALCNDGRLDECIGAYDAYLAKYPWARAASEARDEALRLKNAERRGGPKESTKNAWQRFKSKVKRAFD